MDDHVFPIENAAPPERAFDLWLDVERMPEWNEGLTGVTDLSGAPGQAGTRYTALFGRSESMSRSLWADRRLGDPNRDPCSGVAEHRV